MTRWKKLFEKSPQKTDPGKDTPQAAKAEPQLVVLQVQNTTKEQQAEIYAWCTQYCGAYGDGWHGVVLHNQLHLMFCYPQHQTEFQKHFAELECNSAKS